eukprot:TRINITY_DN235_c0_g1_i2.p1 TRINITY_DN235_c0_g1~~TRINITY_DN235_c0_g1_i2.p1  ORF type:complete len:474 (-),score=85.44 TRINITY_DN235_c0_g1_i2:374-1795(-)
MIQSSESSNRNSTNTQAEQKKTESQEQQGKEQNLIQLQKNQLSSILKNQGTQQNLAPDQFQSCCSNSRYTDRPQWDQKIYEALSKNRLIQSISASPGHFMELEISSKQLLYKNNAILTQLKTPQPTSRQEKKNYSLEGSKVFQQNFIQHPRSNQFAQYPTNRGVPQDQKKLITSSLQLSNLNYFSYKSSQYQSLTNKGQIIQQMNSLLKSAFKNKEGQKIEGYSSEVSAPSQLMPLQRLSKLDLYQQQQLQQKQVQQQQQQPLQAKQQDVLSEKQLRIFEKFTKLRAIPQSPNKNQIYKSKPKGNNNIQTEEEEVNLREKEIQKSQKKLEAIEDIQRSAEQSKKKIIEIRSRSKNRLQEFIEHKMATTIPSPKVGIQKANIFHLGTVLESKEYVQSHFISEKGLDSPLRKNKKYKENKLQPTHRPTNSVSKNGLSIKLEDDLNQQRLQSMKNYLAFQIQKSPSNYSQITKKLF